MPIYGNRKTSSPRFASGLWLQETLYFAGKFALPGLRSGHVRHGIRPFRTYPSLWAVGHAKRATWGVREEPAYNYMSP